LDLSAAVLPITAAGLLNFVLALALLALNPRGQASRVFALILFARTASHLHWAGAELARAAGDAAAGAFWDRAYVDASAFVTFLLVWFVLVFPRRRRWVPEGPLVPLALAVAGAAVELAFFLDRGLFLPLTNPTFVAFGQLSSVLFAVAGLAFTLDYARSAPGPTRKSIELVALGFALVGAYDGTLLVAGYPRSLLYGAELPGYAVLLLAATVAILGALVLALARAALQGGDAELRRGARRFLALLALPALTGALVAAGPLPVVGPGSLFFAGVWRLPLPLLVSYGLLRTQLFDIDVRLRWTVKQGTLASVFVAAFVGVSEVVQQTVSAEAGPVVGVAAAAMLVFAVGPLQRGAERVARRAVPRGEATPEELAARKIDVYKMALERALAEHGTLRPNDERFLRELRGNLGLSDRDHVVLLRAVSPARASA
jgi:hypothetical protein